MKYRQLGRSGIVVSEIGYGCWPIGGGWGATDDAGDIRSLHEARQAGITFFDTAMAYGAGGSERLLGQAFKDSRSDIVIADKISPKTDLAGPVDGVYPYDWVIECTEASLKRLGTDYIDVQQIHQWRNRFTDAGGWYDAMQKLKDDGKIRSFGISTESWEPTGAVAITTSGKIDVVQDIYNVFDQEPTNSTLLPAAVKTNTGVIGRVPLFEGLLSGSIEADYEWNPGDWRKNFFTDDRLTTAMPHIGAIKDIAQGVNLSLAELCIKFCLSHQAISTVIVGMRNPNHVTGNCAISDLPDLSVETLRALYDQAWLHGWLYPWN